MVSHPSLMSSDFCPLNRTATAAAKSFRHFRCASLFCHYIPQPQKKSFLLIASIRSTTLNHGGEAGEHVAHEEPKIKWADAGAGVTAAQKQAISELPPKMSNRCKALMKRVICFSPQHENLPVLLAAWAIAMKPRRADWLSVLKEMKRIENPLITEVMEYALLEDSFEANVRDYTKLIHIYGKQNLLENAENAYRAMKSRGFTCDQVILTVLIDLYSKAGDFTRAKEVFEEIKLLGSSPDKRAYGSMIMAYIRANMLDNGEKLIKEMEARGVYAGKEVYKALLRAYSTIGDSSGAQRVFDAVQFAAIVPDTKLCALLVNAYCVAGESDKARSVLENMRSVGLKPCDKCVSLMLSAYEKENSLETALAFLIELEEDGILIGEEASQVLAQWFHRLGVVDKVEEVLRGFSDKRSQKKRTPLVRIK